MFEDVVGTGTSSELRDSDRYLDTMFQIHDFMASERRSKNKNQIAHTTSRRMNVWTFQFTHTPFFLSSFEVLENLLYSRAVRSIQWKLRKTGFSVVLQGTLYKL